MTNAVTRNFQDRLAIPTRGILVGAAMAATVFAAAPAFAESDGHPAFTQVAEAAIEPVTTSEGKATRTETKRAYLGSAPWICTPSGFGQTAHCFQRTSYN